jgi:hypothetical protein
MRPENSKQKHRRIDEFMTLLGLFSLFAELIHRRLI